MPLHSVRFDPETEQALERVCDATGASPSEVLKQGVVTLARKLDRRVVRHPFDVYQTLDLGPGGYAQAPARRAKQELGRVIGRKRGR